MAEQKFIDKIEDLRHHTYSRIAEVQKDLCPMHRELYLDHRWEYWYEGYKYNVWEEDTHVYAVTDFPYCYDNELKNTTFTDTLDNLVENDKVWPLLMFIDGKVVQWSTITVIHDYDYTYLKISDCPAESFTANIVVFPLGSKTIRYGEDNDVLTTSDRKGFYFNKSGYRVVTTDFVDLSVRFEILDTNIYYKEVDLRTLRTSGSNILQFEDLPDGYIPTLKNILMFDYEGKFNTNLSYNFTDIYSGSYGLFKFIGQDTSIYWAILMYNTKGSKETGSHLYDRQEDLDRSKIINMLTSNTDTSAEIWTDIINPLIQIFDFDHSKSLDYDTNISNAIKYITRYDFRLWRDTFTEDLKIKSLTYTGQEFKNLSDEKGYVHYSRKHSDLIQDVVMVFVNNKLYEYSIDIIYTNNTVHVPIFGILDDDHVEVIIFTECNNNILDIKVQDSTTPIYIHPEYDLEDCYVMSEECPDAEYETPTSLEGRKQYIVDLTYTTSGDYYYITFANSYYYGKDLKIVPKKQFRSYRYKQTGGNYKITLPTQFNYCHDPDRYLIFVNGKKIDKTEYTITFMNKNRPFYKLVLYLSTILDAGDYVDIYYIPELLVEKYKQESMPKSGLLLLEDTDTSINYPTTYPLSKYTSMVFINGLKVNPLDIKDVSLNCMLINVDKYERDEDGNIIYDGEGNPVTNNHYVDSVDNITIMEYVTGNKEVAGYLKGLYEQIPTGQEYDPSLIDFNKSASDNWKDLITTILSKYQETEKPYAGLQKIFGNIFEIENPAADYKDSFADLKSVLYDVIIDYYLNSDEATTGEEFTYDFESDNFSAQSETSDTKLINLVPDKDKLLDYEITDNIATTSDVKEGKKFISANDN